MTSPVPIGRIVLPVPELNSLLRVWRRISAHLEVATEDTGVNKKEVKKTVLWLATVLANQTTGPTQAAIPTATAQVTLRLRKVAGKDDQSPAKRGRSPSPAADISMPSTKRAKAETVVILDDESEDVVEDVVDPSVIGPPPGQFDFDASKCRALTYAGHAPVGADTLSKPTHREMLVLAYPKDWLCDTVIDAYLALVCETGNLKIGGMQSSPAWYAWTTFSITAMQKDPQSGAIQRWPPVNFPNARLEDVRYHIFPVHQGNHWTWAVLTDWTRLDFYSSLAGYDAGLWPVWDKIMANWFHPRLPASKRLGRPPLSVPEQPKQRNDFDCGPFMLCGARWLMEGWDLRTLTQSDFPLMRRRMLFELEKWSLSAS